MDANGCISVATHALTGLIYQSKSTKHAGKSDETQVTFDERSICSPNPDVCLSPFAVSLSRLRKNEPQPSQLSYHASFQSSFHSPAVPFTPSNLNTYTNRLSNMTPGNTLNYAPSASSLQAAICLPNQCETSVQTDKFTPLNADQIANLLDEPLLPKVCLRLVWSEPSSTRSFSTPVNLSCVSPMRHASNFKKENSKYCAPSSGRFALLSRRLPDLPFPLPKTEKPCNNSSSIRNRGEVLSGDTSDTSHLTVIQDNSPVLLCHKYGPMKSPAFLAVDLISVSWICFLTSSPGLDDRQSRLACLRINDEETALCTSDNKRTDDYQAVFGDLTYLRACDAVYVPYSRITICLDPGVGIVLYTGIKKFLSPPRCMKQKRP
ncbi:unnamed protein product [Trichobilharzia regenti]|nr:unnamed protein product [Trichobilharzia regenti]